MAAKRRGRQLWIGVALAVPAMLLAAILFVPEVLIFPYHTKIGTTDVYSTSPLDPAVADVLGQADTLVSEAPGGWSPPPRRIFLTDGGWRWSLLALRSAGAFAFTRPFSNAIVVTRSDVAADTATNGRPLGGRRSLSGVIAHETMHLLLEDRYGTVRSRFFPAWKVEGFADHVARESSLSDVDAARLRASGEDHPALPYFDARRRVAAMLAAGTTVDELFTAPQLDS